MQLLRLFVVLIVSLLPMASFAYDSDGWDGLLSIQPSQAVGQTPTVRRQGVDQAAKPSPKLIRDSLTRIDQEILVLRAEFARRNGDYGQVKHYIEQLSHRDLLPIFSQRVSALKQFARDGSPTTGLEASSSLAGHQLFEFSQAKNAVTVILLPLTGEYERLGNALLESLNSALERLSYKGSVVVFDTQSYNTAFDLWEVVKYYEPDFIFGPLQKSFAVQWHQLNTKVPTLYFNALDTLFDYERALSPSKRKGLEQVYAILEEGQFKNVLVLTDQSDSSQLLEKQFHQAWLVNYPQGSYQHQTISKTAGEAVQASFNVPFSKGRHAWLQKVIERRLVFTPRVRRDIELIISFVPQNKMIQIAPLLNFYQLTDSVHVWYPSQEPSLVSIKELVSSWRQVYAILPAYLVNDSMKTREKPQQFEKTGLFYALGQVAVDIVKKPLLLGDEPVAMDTRFGQLVFDRFGQYSLLPVVYWIDQGVFDVVSLTPESSFE